MRSVAAQRDRPGGPFERIKRLELAPDGDSYALYFEDRLRLGERVVADLGVRWDKKTYLPPEEADERFSPRLSLLVPLNARTTIEFGAGKTDKSALSLLGIPEGIVRNTIVGDKGLEPADGKGQIYGLGLKLDGDLKLETVNDMAHAAAEVAAAMGVIRKAYKDLVAAASPKSPAQQAASAAATGKVPAYLQNQIANYQAALARLGG